MNCRSLGQRHTDWKAGPVPDLCTSRDLCISDRWLQRIESGAIPHHYPMNSVLPPVASLDLIVPATIALCTLVQAALHIHLIFVPSKHSEFKSSWERLCDNGGQLQMWSLFEFLRVMKALQGWLRLRLEMIILLNICTAWATMNMYGVSCIVLVSMYVKAKIYQQMSCTIILLCICSWFTKGIMLIR